VQPLVAQIQGMLGGFLKLSDILLYKNLGEYYVTW
jgi:hypothetical protein